MARSRRRPVAVLVPEETLSELGVLPRTASQPPQPCDCVDGSSPQQQLEGKNLTPATSESVMMNSVTSSAVVPVEASNPVPKTYISHSDVEKKRKQKISACIQQLAALLQLQDQVGKMTRTNILELSVGKIEMLQAANAVLRRELSDMREESVAEEDLKQRLQELVVEHILLKQQLFNCVINSHDNRERLPSQQVSVSPALEYQVCQSCPSAPGEPSPHVSLCQRESRSCDPVSCDSMEGSCDQGEHQASCGSGDVAKRSHDACIEGSTVLGLPTDLIDPIPTANHQLSPPVPHSTTCSPVLDSCHVSPSSTGSSLMEPYQTSPIVTEPRQISPPVTEPRQISPPVMEPRQISPPATKCHQITTEPHQISPHQQTNHLSTPPHHISHPLLEEHSISPPLTASHQMRPPESHQMNAAPHQTRPLLAPQRSREHYPSPFSHSTQPPHIMSLPHQTFNPPRPSHRVFNPPEPPHQPWPVTSLLAATEATTPTYMQGQRSLMTPEGVDSPHIGISWPTMLNDGPFPSPVVQPWVGRPCHHGSQYPSQQPSPRQRQRPNRSSRRQNMAPYNPHRSHQMLTQHSQPHPQSCDGFWRCPVVTTNTSHLPRPWDSSLSRPHCHPYIQHDHVMSCEAMTTPPFMAPGQVPTQNAVWRPYSEPNRSTGFYLSDILAEPTGDTHGGLQLGQAPPPTTRMESFFVDRLLDDIS